MACQNVGVKKILLFLIILSFITIGCSTSPVRQKVLANGIRIVAIHLPHAPVVSLQAWYSVGARNEKKGWEGASHFLEHLMFKRGKDATGSTLASRVELHTA
jgi:predicted Zn-dependent peptidase